MVIQVIGGVHRGAAEFGWRRQGDVGLKTPSELFGLRVRYDFLRVHQPRRSFPLDQTESIDWHEHVAKDEKSRGKYANAFSVETLNFHMLESKSETCQEFFFFGGWKD